MPDVMGLLVVSVPLSVPPASGRYAANDDDVMYPDGLVLLYGVKPNAPVTSEEPSVTAPVRPNTLVTGTETTCQVPSPRRNVVASAVPVPSRADAMVPALITLAFIVTPDRTPASDNEKIVELYALLTISIAPAEVSLNHLFGFVALPNVFVIAKKP